MCVYLFQHFRCLLRILWVGDLSYLVESFCHFTNFSSLLRVSIHALFALPHFWETLNLASATKPTYPPVSTLYMLSFFLSQ